LIFINNGVQNQLETPYKQFIIIIKEADGSPVVQEMF